MLKFPEYQKTAAGQKRQSLSDRCLTVTSLCHYRRSPAALTLTRLSEIQIGGRPQEVHAAGRLRREDGLPVRTELQGHSDPGKSRAGEDDILELRYMTLDSD